MMKKMIMETHPPSHLWHASQQLGYLLWNVSHMLDLIEGNYTYGLQTLISETPVSSPAMSKPLTFLLLSFLTPI